MTRTLWMLMAATLLSGCFLFKKQPTTSLVGTQASVPLAPATHAPDADAAFLLRESKEGTDAAIAKYEALLTADPGRVDAREIRVRLGILYYYKGTWFDREASKKEKMDILWKGREHACNALKADPEYAALIADGARVQDAVHALEADDADALYWCALDWASWGQQKGVLRVALDIPKVRAMLEHLKSVAEDYAFGGVHRFFGGFFVEIPPFAGQDADASKASFERGVTLAPNWPENYLEYARYYATFTRDRPMFESLLATVVEMDVPTDPTYRAEFVIAKAQAEDLLGQADELFDN